METLIYFLQNSGINNVQMNSIFLKVLFIFIHFYFIIVSIRVFTVN